MIIPRTDELLQRKIDGFIFLFDRKESQLHELNHTASRIWEMLQDNLPLGSITQIICDEFDVSLQQAEKDIKVCIQEMKEKKILFSQ